MLANSNSLVVVTLKVAPTARVATSDKQRKQVNLKVPCHIQFNITLQNTHKYLARIQN